MTSTPDKTGVATLRAADPLTETDTLQAIWEASYAADDPASWARGGWSVAAWATGTRVLERAGRPIGVVAVRAELTPDDAMPARLALEVAERNPKHAATLLDGAIDLVRVAGGHRVRLFIATRATWTQDAARAAGFEPVRTIAHMLLPASAPLPSTNGVPGLNLRTIRPGEDQAVVDALNRNWVGTWNFVEIPLGMLQEDLVGQREGMFLGVDANDRIIATCHAVYEPTQRNPDGGPRAWISNLTVDANYRQRGVARAMLATGLEYLRGRGAGSITLGVDASDPKPFGLYQSVGFEVWTSMEAWDKVI